MWKFIPCISRCLFRIVFPLVAVSSYGQTGTADNSSGTPEISYPAGPLTFSYGGNPKGLPDLRELGQAYFALSGYSEPVSLGSLSLEGGPVFTVTENDVFLLSEVVLHYLKSKGFEGIVVFPDPKQIDPLTGKDLRQPTATRLDLKVWVSRTESLDLHYKNFGDPLGRRLERIERLLIKWGKKNQLVGHPLRESLVRVVDRLGSHPKRSSRLLLSPADEPGSINAVVRLRDNQWMSAGLNASNSGSETTGEWLFGGYARFYQPTHGDDEIGLFWSASNTFERYAFGLNYERPLVFPEVLDFSFNLSYSRYDASSFAITRIDFEGQSFGADLDFRLSPLGWENDSWRFEMFAGLNYEDVSASNSLVGAKGSGSFVSPRFGLSLNKKGGIVRSLSSLVLSGNLNGIPELQKNYLGGIDTEERLAHLGLAHSGIVDLGKLFGGGGSSAEQGNRHLLFFRFDGQQGLGGYRRLPQKQFILGGSSTIRGYPEAVVAGDNGFLFSLEYRWKLFQLGASGKGKGFAMSLAPFFDFGATYLNDPLSYESDHHLAGTGIGLQFDLPYGGLARLDFAKPLKEVVNAGTSLDGTRSDDARVHASIRLDY
jgi:hemolysin activation/secretion protein